MEFWYYGSSGLLFRPVALVEILLTTANQVSDLFQGKYMFYGNDSDGKGYSTCAHLAEVVGTLGWPPLDLLKQGKRKQEFFTEDSTYDFFSVTAFAFRSK